MTKNNEALFNFIREGDLDSIKKVLQQDEKLINAKDANGASALIFALYNGRNEIAELLVELGAEVGFYEAAAMDRVDVLEKHLQQNPDIINQVASDGFSALGLSCFFSAVNVMKLLLSRGADPNQASKNIMNVAPIHSAAANRDEDKAFELSKLLVESGANINVAQHQGWTPLQQAATHGQLELVKFFLRHGADKKAQADDGSTALSLAEKNGHAEVVKLLQND